MLRERAADASRDQLRGSERGYRRITGSRQRRDSEQHSGMFGDLCGRNNARHGRSLSECQTELSQPIRAQSARSGHR